MQACRSREVGTQYAVTFLINLSGELFIAIENIRVFKALKYVCCYGFLASYSGVLMRSARTADASAVSVQRFEEIVGVSSLERRHYTCDS